VTRSGDNLVLAFLQFAYQKSAQQDEGPEGSWVHAYLHRKEGDQGNAAYWYSRAGKPVCRDPLETEWLSIATDLLG